VSMGSSSRDEFSRDEVPVQAGSASKAVSLPGAGSLAAAAARAGVPLDSDNTASSWTLGAAMHVYSPGDLLQALPGAQNVDSNGVEVYRAGDEGTVSRIYYEAGRRACCEIVWSRTGRKSNETRPRQRFRFVQRQNLMVGDLLLVLPGRKCAMNDVELCAAGDEVTVVRFGRTVSSSATEDYLEVACARTGKLCTAPRASWMSVFHFLRRQTLEVGDLIQALPGSRAVLNSEGHEVYADGDQGTVMRFYHRQVAPKEGKSQEDSDNSSGGRSSTGRWRNTEERMEIFWARSGKRSHELAAHWMQHFFLVPKAGPEVSWPNRFSKSTASSSTQGYGNPNELESNPPG